MLKQSPHSPITARDGALKSGGLSRMTNERKPNTQPKLGGSYEWRSQHTDSLKREET